MAKRRPAILLRVGKSPELLPEVELDLKPIYDLLGCDCIDMARVHPLLIEELERRFQVHLGDYDMVRLIVDDNGLNAGLPLNSFASALAGQPIAGDGLLMEVE